LESAIEIDNHQDEAVDRAAKLLVDEMLGQKTRARFEIPNVVSKPSQKSRTAKEDKKSLKKNQQRVRQP
jgi:hypothetical protein